MRYYILTDYIVKLFVIVLCIWTTSCAAQPIHKCTRQLQTPQYPPGDAKRTFSHACHHFEKHTEYEASLENTSIKFHRDPEAMPCTSSTPGCAFLMGDGSAQIHVARGFRWRQISAHEIYHVLLWRNEPDLHPDGHHRRMLELRLCGSGLSACGYRAGPSLSFIFE